MVEGRTHGPNGGAQAAPVVLLVAVAVQLLAAVVALAGGGGSPSGARTVLVSRAGPAGPGGDANSIEPAISASGRFVAFASRARNLVAGDGPRRDIFRRDMSTGQNVLVSRANGAAGPAADGFSDEAAISADGRFVAFRSTAENLSAEDTAFSDVFVRDLAAGTTTLVSRASGAAGAPGSDESGTPSISDDGRFVAFESNAPNLAAPDSDTDSDVFIRDLVADTTTLVSRASGAAGAPADDFSAQAEISGDGRLVAFESRAANLSAADTDDFDDLYVRDLAAGTTTLVPRGARPGETTEGDFSADGRFLAYTFRSEQVLRADLSDNSVTRVSVGDRGAAGDPFHLPSISDDGRFVAFQTQGNGVTPDDAAGRRDVFVRDMEAGLTLLVSRESGLGGLPADAPSSHPSITADGRFVAFDSLAANLSGADRDETFDVFRRRVVYSTPPALPRCRRRVVTKVGTPGADVIRGTPAADVIASFGGNDVVRGKGRQDTICTGAGRDRAFGNRGANAILGGPGDDHLNGGNAGFGGGGAFVDGGRGDDFLVAEDGSDVLRGASGADTIRGKAARDFLFGGAGPDRIFGGGGNDDIAGGAGNDFIRGGPSHDDIDGGPGRDDQADRARSG